VDAGAGPELPDPRPRFVGFRLLAAAGGRLQLPVRLGGPWRDARRTAGGLPHRDPGDGQGPRRAGEPASYPYGAKGGFVGKHLPDQSDSRPTRRGARLLPKKKEGRSSRPCMGHHLQTCTTSNVVPPPGVVRHDGERTVPGVAADKGHRHLPPTRQTRSSQANGTGSGDAFRLRRSRVTTTEWRLPRRGMGVGGSSTSTYAQAWTRRHHRVNCGPARRTVRGGVRQYRTLLSEQICWSPRSTTGTSSRPRARRAASFRRSAAAVAVPRSSWRGDYSTRRDLPGAGCGPKQRQDPPGWGGGGFPAGQLKVSSGSGRRVPRRFAAGPAHLRTICAWPTVEPCCERRHRHLRQGRGNRTHL